jgi:3-isopropylmalate/(R)-2-methylmalate dehydratase small subunit
MAGLLSIEMPSTVVDRLWRMAEEQPHRGLTVDLETQRVRTDGLAGSDGLDEPFELDADIRTRMLAGLDQIGATLRYADAVAEYEARRRPSLPTSRQATG